MATRPAETSASGDSKNPADPDMSMTESSSPFNEYGPACKLTGTIFNLKVTRDSASFFFTRDDQMQMGVVAIAAAIAGLGGPAIASASNASAVDEEADYLEFDLNGQSDRKSTRLNSSH